MNKQAIDLLIQQNPGLRSAREKLEKMQAGTYCIHRSWGIGQIREYDEKENKLIIDFEENQQGHAMDPAFCVDKLDVLNPQSILVRQRQDPAVIESLIKHNPCDLIVEILSHCPDQAAGTPQLERLLGRLLGEDKFRKWWSTTKRLLVKDPRVAVPSRKADPYILRDEPVKAEDEILEDFRATKAPKKKIGLAAKLIDLSVKHEDIKEELPNILRDLTASLQEMKALNEGERLHGIWIRNDLARFIHEDVDALLPTSASILLASRDLSELAGQIPSSHYHRYLNLIERVFPEEWNKIYFDLLKNSSGKLTGECINYLLDKKCEEQLQKTLERWLQEHALRGPLLIWVIKNRNTRKFGKMIAGLINPRLLAAILYAIDTEALQTSTNRRIPLAELLGDDPELITELLSEANPETAYDLATTLMLNQGFDELSKKSLLARFIKLFPHIQGLVDETTGARPKGYIVSVGSYETRKKEYDELINVRIPENKQAIATAREHGDLRENAEYKMARQEQETLLARKAQLEYDLARAQTTDFSDAPTDVVGIGSVVTLRQGSTSHVLEYAILGAWDSDPERHILSYLTPLGHSLIGKPPGESVKVDIDKHEETYTLLSIARWVDRPTS